MTSSFPMGLCWGTRPCPLLSPQGRVMLLSLAGLCWGQPTTCTARWCPLGARLGTLLDPPRRWTRHCQPSPPGKKVRHYYCKVPPIELPTPLPVITSWLSLNICHPNLTGHDLNIWNWIRCFFLSLNASFYPCICKGVLMVTLQTSDSFIALLYGSWHIWSKCFSVWFLVFEFSSVSNFKGTPVYVDCAQTCLVWFGLVWFLF